MWKEVAHLTVVGVDHSHWMQLARGCALVWTVLNDRVLLSDSWYTVEKNILYIVKGSVDGM